MLPCCLPFRNAGGLQLLCCQGFEVKHYDVTLDAWNLKPSDVCNVGVKPRRCLSFIESILMRLNEYFDAAYLLQDQGKAGRHLWQEEKIG